MFTFSVSLIKAGTCRFSITQPYYAYRVSYILLHLLPKGLTYDVHWELIAPACAIHFQAIAIALENIPMISSVQSKLLTIVRIHSTNKNMVTTCVQCKTTFANQHTLKRHLCHVALVGPYLHTSKRPVCQKVSLSSVNHPKLKIPNWAIFKNIKLYSCPVCGKSSVSLEHFLPNQRGNFKYSNGLTYMTCNFR